MHRANNTNFNKPTLSVDNVENYPVEIIGLESNNEESKQMKTSYKAMKDLVDAGVIKQAQLDEAVKLGKVSMPRTGKLDFAPVEVKNAWNVFVEVATANFSEWNETLEPLGDSISEVSLNCKK
tara:strand:+ start:8079 stop:8447 length:369 start_codon:yes stop_codon:yes gene_type:complete